MIKCEVCGSILDRNTIGLNKKFLGRNIKRFLCLNHLALHLDISVEELLEKIEEFKTQGCALFE